MSLVDQVRKLEQQVVDRLKELEPLTREYDQLRKVAERLGLKYTPGSAKSDDGRRRRHAAPHRQASGRRQAAARKPAKAQAVQNARPRAAKPSAKPRGTRSTSRAKGEGRRRAASGARSRRARASAQTRRYEPTTVRRTACGGATGPTPRGRAADSSARIPGSRSARSASDSAWTPRACTAS